MKRRYYPDSTTLADFIEDIKKEKIITNDVYQRKAGVWKKKMKEELIATIFIGLPIGGVTLWVPPTRDDNIELIDGLQRISTILEYMNNGFALPSVLVDQVVKMFWEDLQLENSGESRKIFNNFNHGVKFNLKYKNLPLVMKRAFDNYILTLSVIKETPMDVIRNYFVRIQNQEALKAGEVIRSLPNNKLVLSLKKLEINKFAVAFLFQISCFYQLVVFIFQIPAVYTCFYQLGRFIFHTPYVSTNRDMALPYAVYFYHIYRISLPSNVCF